MDKQTNKQNAKCAKRFPKITRQTSWERFRSMSITDKQNPAGELTCKRRARCLRVYRNKKPSLIFYIRDLSQALFGFVHQERFCHFVYPGGVHCVLTLWRSVVAIDCCGSFSLRLETLTYVQACVTCTSQHFSQNNNNNNNNHHRQRITYRGNRLR